MSTKIKQALWLLGFSAISVVGSAQENCGTIPTAEQMEYLENTREARQHFHISHARSTISYPIQFHVVRRSDGTGGLSASTVTGLLTEFNNHYAPANLQFFECSSINYIDDDTYFSLETSEESAMGAAHDVANVINIYLVDYAGGYCGWTRLPPSTIDRIILKNSCATNGSTAVHEVGHYFSLYHTHGKSNTGTTDELVDGSNCSTAGDDVCDTPADPNLSGNVNSSCNYTGSATDANGDSYSPNPNNIMSYSLKACRNFMSSGQLSRVAYSAANDRSYLSCVTTPPTCTTVSSFPYSEGFESGTGNWVQASDDNFDWTRKTGTTGSSNTGPSAAAEGSYYMYTEASSPNYPSKSANFLSPCFDFSSLSSPELSFQYHMYGATMGTLSIQVSTDGGNTWSSNIWSLSGDQGNSWKSATVGLSSYSGQSSVRIRMRGVTGTSYTGDISIDDISISGSAAISYCSAEGTNQSYEYIQSVSFGGATNASGNNGGYLDGTSTTFHISSTSTTMTLTPGYASSSYAENWRVYVDANGDGDFEDADETIYTGAGTGAISGSITVPSSMVSPTRMRVVMNYSSSISPCGSFTYGEVEDYTVELVAPDQADLTSINEQSHQNNMAVYPNPSFGTVNLNFYNYQEETVTVRVLDQIGRILLNYEVSSAQGANNEVLDLNNFQSGYYFIQLSTSSSTETKRILITK